MTMVNLLSKKSRAEHGLLRLVLPGNAAKKWVSLASPKVFS